jgi:alcohol dehydrogenase
VGSARDPNSTLAALGALYRWGRIVLMGSSMAPIPLDYMPVMFNNLEIIGNFHACAERLSAASGTDSLRPLEMSRITPKVFSLSDLMLAMEYACKANSLELVVVT